MSQRERQFGRPNALPGQSGYKMKESDRLEDEAAEMALRLQALRSQMSREKERMDASAKVGGNRWRSARADRGSIRNYAKDVQERRSQKVTEARRAARTGARASVASSAGNSTTHGGSSGRDVHQWRVTDVGAWLNTIDLGQYATVFAQNEISGEVLLDLGLNDLDYMQIRVLAHRKLLLKGIEDLKVNGHPTADLRASSASAKPSSEGLSASRSSSVTSTDDSGLIYAEAKDPHGGSTRGAVGRVHWSQVTPLSENQVSGGTQYDGVNAADDTLSGGMYDEAKAQREFQDAVMAWRRKHSSDPSQRDPEASTGASTGTATVGKEQPHGDDGMWHNPWAPVSSPGRSGEAGVGGLGEDAPTSTPKVVTVTATQEHEAFIQAEHNEFVKAVQRWRTGGSGGSDGEAKATSSTSTATATAAMTETPRAGGKSSEQVAEELAKVLDSKYETQAAEIARRKEQAREQLEKHEAELKLAASAKEPSVCEEGGGIRGEWKDTAYDTDSDSDDLNAPLSPVNSTPPDSPPLGDVDVSLVESTMGFSPRPEAIEDAGYVVEEEDSDDEL